MMIRRKKKEEKSRSAGQALNDQPILHYSGRMKKLTQQFPRVRCLSFTIRTRKKVKKTRIKALVRVNLVPNRVL